MTSIGLVLAVAFAVSAAMATRAEAAECMTAQACFDKAASQRAAARDFFNQGVWFREYSKQYFVLAEEYNRIARFAFAAGNPQAGWAKAAADDFSTKAVENANAADERFRQAAFTSAAADASFERGLLIGDGSLAIASSSGGFCDTALHHPSDPDAFGSGAPNSYACVRNKHWIRVCDRHVDGNRVRAWFNSNIDRPAVDGPWATQWAPSQGCVTHNVGLKGNIMRYRVCVENQGCSRGVYFYDDGGIWKDVSWIPKDEAGYIWPPWP